MRFAALGLAVAVLGGCLGGCATTAPVQVAGDNYCRIAKRISWSKADTAPTVHQIRIHNAKFRRVCG